MAGLSRDETLVVLEHSEHGDSRHKALRVLRLGADADGDGEVVADLWDGDGLGLSVMGFAPLPGDPRVLALHERTGRPRPFLWDPVAGTSTGCRSTTCPATCPPTGTRTGAPCWCSPSTPDGPRCTGCRSTAGRSSRSPRPAAP